MLAAGKLIAGAKFYDALKPCLSNFASSALFYRSMNGKEPTRTDRQAQARFLGLAMGELAFFLLAWTLGIAAALNGDQTHSRPDDIAASGGYSNMSDVLD